MGKNKLSKPEVTDETFEELYNESLVSIKLNLDLAEEQYNNYLPNLDEPSMGTRLKLQFAKWKYQILELVSIVDNLHIFIKSTISLVISYIKKLEDIQNILIKNDQENSEHFIYFLDSFNQILEPFLKKTLIPYQKLHFEALTDTISSSNAHDFINQLQISSKNLSEFKLNIIQLDIELRADIKKIISLDQVIDEFKKRYASE